ncbi:MAG: NAD(P)-dependent dehydrogenase (short-subunit alcohol dehydrogenase family) [Myxococcota bacterium]|jgi:NAD(P)-dependent dehydrogenase (short-subunit alcohol dehydrogenase family)
MRPARARSALNVLITGCRSGFGLLAAETAARRGHTVFAGLRDLDTAGPLRERTASLDVHPVQLDVTDPAQREAVMSAIEGEHGGLHAVVNNAGVALAGPLEEIDEDELRRLFEVNVFAVWALCVRALPGMRARGSGCIVNVSSMAGRMGVPCLGAYAATKHAVSGMTESLRHEARPFGVRVVLLEPGPYKTDIFGRNRTVARRALAPGGPYAELKAQVERMADSATATAADPQDVADRIADVLIDPNPAPRHPMGPGSVQRQVLKRVVPDRLVDWLVRRAIARGT